MEFFQAVKQIGIFMICAQAILHFKPSAKYEKYLKLLISAMVLVQILVPIVNFFSGKDSEVFYARMETIQKEIDREMEQLQIENAINEENVLRETEEEIKSRIDNIVSKYELSVSCIQFRQTDYTGKLTVYVQEGKKTQDISVQSIEVESININSKPESLNPSEQNMKEEKLRVLRKEISVDLNISEEEIEVLWYE